SDCVANGEAGCGERDSSGSQRRLARGRSGDVAGGHHDTRRNGSAPGESGELDATGGRPAGAHGGTPPDPLSREAITGNGSTLPPCERPKWPHPPYLKTVIVATGMWCRGASSAAFGEVAR